MVDSDEIDMLETERTMEMLMGWASEEERLVVAKTPGNLLKKIAMANVSIDEVVGGAEIFDVDVEKTEVRVARSHGNIYCFCFDKFWPIAANLGKEALSFSSLSSFWEIR
ncbi:hypothetical protein ACLB2K_016782 [Fragaria x ananassa]